MKRTITRLFDDRADAEAAVRELEAGGIPENDLSIVAPKTGGEEHRSFAGHGEGHGEVAREAGKGAGAGGAVGGAAGLLGGLGVLAIPGIGPAIGAGWLVTTLIGAAVGAGVGGAAGGILGALKDAGVPDKEAHVYAEGVKRGGVLVSARVDEEDAPRVEKILGARGVDTVAREGAYREAGWSGFNPTDRAI